MRIARAFLFLVVNYLLCVCCSPNVDKLSVSTDVPTATITQEASNTDVPGDPVPWRELVIFTDGQANYKSTRDEDQSRLSIISRQEDIDMIANWIRPDHLALVQNVDYNESLVVIIFSGYRGQTGYGIDVHQIVKNGNVVTLSVSFTEPPEGEPRGQIITSPYLIVEIQKNVLPKDAIFILIANGKEIDQKPSN